VNTGSDYHFVIMSNTFQLASRGRRRGYRNLRAFMVRVVGAHRSN